jgi:type I restriction enzyme R subunit
MRAYAAVADQLEAAGYSEADIARIKQQLQHYLNVREIIRRASGESLDLKAYEADMRRTSSTLILRLRSRGRSHLSTACRCWT